MQDVRCPDCGEILTWYTPFSMAYADHVRYQALERHRFACNKFGNVVWIVQAGTPEAPGRVLTVCKAQSVADEYVVHNTRFGEVMFVHRQEVHRA